jgi:hypothetical protein
MIAWVQAILKCFEVCHLTTLSVLRLYSVDYRMINEFGVVGGMRSGKGNRSTRRKPAPATLCLPQIPHDLTLGRTQGFAAETLHISISIVLSINAVIKRHQNNSLSA